MSKLIFTTGYNDLGQQTIKFKPKGGKFRIQGEGSEMNDKRNMMSASELEDLQDRNDDAFLDVRAGTTLRDMTEEYETHTVINETEDDIMEKHDIGDTSEVQTRRMKANTDSKKLKRLNTEDIKSSTVSWDGSEKKKKKKKKEKKEEKKEEEEELEGLVYSDSDVEEEKSEEETKKEKKKEEIKSAKKKERDMKWNPQLKVLTTILNKDNIEKSMKFYKIKSRSVEKDKKAVMEAWNKGGGKLANPQF